MTSNTVSSVSRLAAEAIAGSCAFRVGDFVLSSGRRSRYYVDARCLLSDPARYRLLASLLYYAFGGLLSRADAVVGVATGGVPWASFLAYSTGKPLGYVRSGRKGHGLGRRVEGWSGPGRAVLVDDVATTGGSLASAVEALREAGVIVEEAVVILDRGEGAAERLSGLGVRLYSLTTLGEVVSLHAETP